MFGLLHSVQIFVFFKSIGLGGLLGLISFILSLLRCFLPHVRIVLFLEDVLFFILSAVFTFLFLFSYNAGIPRLYVFVGEAVGFLVLGIVLRSILVAFYRPGRGKT